MATPVEVSSWLQQRIQRYPILLRIITANILVVTFGALIAALITHQIHTFSNVEAILLFLIIGTLFSIVMNYWVIRTVLLPLRELRTVVDQAQPDQKTLPETVIMRSDPDIHRLVEAINSMLERLENRARMLRALSERAINAQEEERKRIARTLHDDTVQSLSYLAIQLERLELDGLENTQLTTQKLAKVRQLVANILDELRKNIWDLRPSILDDLGLCPAIRWLGRLQLGEAGIEVEFDLPGENFRLPAHLETMLFRVTQEALNNILRHSNASKVIIRMLPEPAQITLEIDDDGQGFDVPVTQEEAVSRKKLGLLGIQERISLVDGTVNVISEPGMGTLIQICIPLLENQLVYEEASETSNMKAAVRA